MRSTVHFDGLAHLYVLPREKGYYDFVTRVHISASPRHGAFDTQAEVGTVSKNPVTQAFCPLTPTRICMTDGRTIYRFYRRLNLRVLL